VLNSLSLLQRPNRLQVPLLLHTEIFYAPQLMGAKIHDGIITPLLNSRNRKFTISLHRGYDRFINYACYARIMLRGVLPCTLPCERKYGIAFFF